MRSILGLRAMCRRIITLWCMINISRKLFHRSKTRQPTIDSKTTMKDKTRLERSCSRRIVRRCRRDRSRQDSSKAVTQWNQNHHTPWAAWVVVNYQTLVYRSWNSRAVSKGWGSKFNLTTKVKDKTIHTLKGSRTSSRATSTIQDRAEHPKTSASHLCHSKTTWEMRICKEWEKNKKCLIVEDIKDLRMRVFRICSSLIHLDLLINQRTTACKMLKTTS